MGWYPVNKISIERLTEPRVIRVITTNAVTGTMINDFPYENRMTKEEIEPIMKFIEKEFFQVAM